MIEMVYHLQLNTAMGDAVQFLGVTLHAKEANSWFGALFVALTGLGLFELTRHHFRQQWAEIQTDIEKEIKRRETT
jgi:branched-chain amino acid transport system permease protein